MSAADFEPRRLMFERNREDVPREGLSSPQPRIRSHVFSGRGSETEVGKEKLICSTGGASLAAVGFRRNWDHEMEKSAMAAEQRVVEELLLDGVQEEPQPSTNLQKILSATTMKEWWSLVRASVGPELSQLHWDILRFCKAYELTAQEIQLRRDALAFVERAVREIWPRAEVQLFGSRATDLALPWSDIDVAIMPPEQDLTFRNPTPTQWQNELSKKLYRLGQCRSLEKIPRARVPLLKIIFNSGIACDVSFDARNVQAGEAVIRQFMKQYETLRPLCLVLKFFLGQNKLNELHTGGLSSFCISTMVVSHLQKMDSVIEAERRDLGILLLSFFAHFSNMHNYSADVVSTRADSRSSKLDKGWVNVKLPQLLAVEDPLDSTSDIGKGSYKIEEVRRKFSQAQRILLTHWYNKHVLAQILDMTVNPNQRPAAEKSKKSKRGGRKRCRASSEQDHCILTHEPALKVDRKLNHPQHGSGLVTRSQLDRVVVQGGQHFTSGLRSKRLRSGGFDEDDLHSEELNLAPKTPTIQGRGLLRRTQSNAVDSNSLEANSSPIVKPTESSLRRQTSAEEDCRSVQRVHSQLSQEGSNVLEILVNRAQCSDLSRARQDCSKGPDSLEGSNLTPRKKSWKNLSHETPKEDCSPVQSAAQSHLRHDDIDSAGNRETHDETIDFEFWESQLTVRSRPRKTSFKQREHPILLSETSRGQDSTRTSDSLETSNSTPIGEPMKGKKDKAHEKDSCPPIQAVNSRHLQGVDFEGMGVNQDQRLLVDFWESHLTTPPKPSKESLKHCVTGDSSGTAPESPQNDSETMRTMQNEKPLENCGTGGDIEHAQALRTFLPGEHQSASKMHLKSESEASVEHSSTGGRREHTPAGRTIQHRRSQNSSKKHPEVQDEKLEVDLDFWEAQLTTKRKSRTGSLIHPNSGGAGGRDVQPALANHSGPPAQGKDVVVGEVQGKKNVVDLPGPVFTKEWKSRFGSLQHGREDYTDKQDQTIRHEQLPQGIDLDEARKGQDQEILMGFGEAQLALRQKSEKGPMSNQLAAGGGLEDTPRRLKSAKSSSLQGVNGVVLPVKRSDADQPQTAKDITGRNEDERLLADFWEAQLAPRLKGSKCLSKPVAAGCEEEDVQLVQESHPDQPQHERDIKGRSGEERVFLEFWEAQLAPTLKSSKCPSNLLAVECEEEDEQAALGQDERKLVDFWETHLNPNRRLTKGSFDDAQATDGEVEGGTEKGKDHSYDRILTDFWEAHLTPNLESREGPPRQDGIACEEDVQPVEKTQQELPPQQGSGFAGRSGDETEFSTFWEAYLNPAISRKGYLRRNSTVVT